MSSRAFVITLICLASLGLCAKAQSASADGWVAGGIGLPLLNLQVGWYNIVDSPLEARLYASMVGANMIGGEVLWLSNGQSGFYVGTGLGIATDFNSILAGPHLTLGVDIPINEQSGILVDASLGIYGALKTNPTGSMLNPAPFRVSLNYRWSF